MRKKICVIITIMILAALAAVGFIGYRNQFSLTIDGVKIDKEEFLDAAEQKKYDVTNYFSGKPGGNVDAGFWSREIEGEVPAERLADEAVDHLAYIHAVYGLAKEKGYITDDSYQGLLKRWKNENDSRKEKIEKGEVVYGLSEYTLELYREYEMDTLQKKYCEDPENEGMNISDSDREQYYEEHKDAYQQDDDMVLDYIKIPYADEGMNEEQTDRLKEKLTSVYKKIDGEHPLSALAGEDEELKNYLAHADITAEDMVIYVRSISDILEYAWELKEGESTAVVDDGSCLYLIECTGRKENGMTAMEEVKDIINKTLREERYDEIIAKRAADARVEGDRKRIYFFMKKHINN